MLVSTIYKQGETFLAGGNHLSAGREFERAFEQIADPQSEIARKALFDAASSYFRGGYHDEAIGSYQKMVSLYPNSEYCPDAYYNMALSREELDSHHAAAKDFETLTERYPDYENRMDALLYALEDYRRTDDPDPENLLRVSLKLLELPELDIEKQIELNGEVGQLYWDKGWKKSAANYCARCNDLYDKHPQEDLAYIAARSKFLRGERFFKFYKDVRFRPPFEKNMKSKRTYLRRLVGLYTDAANYKDIFWATAATHKIGEVFEEFHDALLASKAPGDLTPEEKEVYTQQLREIAGPFREKAIEAYRSNLKQAREFSEENEWVEKTRDRLAELNPGEQQESSPSGGETQAGENEES